jgi:NADP-dependent 3-hydroxy acid dehydrogenase YdfG/acyl carrier protein
VLQAPRALNPDGTVLITGGVGELGQELARHLVSKHGARHLVLTSRRGREAPGTDELIESLEALGAETVVIAACDVGERAEVARVLDQIPADHALTGVFHLAGVLDDGVVSELTEERLSRVLRPKVAGAWHLHALTKSRDLSAFVLFSSASGVMGGPGQANYAAANAFLDALAAQRRWEGLSGQSLAWGLWEPQGKGMTSHLGAAELLRIRRSGIRPLSVERGLALLDAAMTRPEAGLVPVQLEVGGMQRQLTESAPLPALLRALVRPGLRRADTASMAASALRQRLAVLPEKERLKALVTLVQEVVAAVLGLAGAAAVPAEAPLKELGLDSLMAVQVRNQLSARAEATLPTTLVFDYPTPKAIAKLLLEKFDLSPSHIWSDSEIRAKLSRVSIAALIKWRLLDVLMQQTDDLTAEEPAKDGEDAIDQMDHDSLLQALDGLLK